MKAGASRKVAISILKFIRKRYEVTGTLAGNEGYEENGPKSAEKPSREQRLQRFEHFPEKSVAKLAGNTEIGRTPMTV